MRGSYEIVHDCDIAVMVERGIATTTKNRFKEKGLTLNVFEEKKTTCDIILIYYEFVYYKSIFMFLKKIISNNDYE